jgi:hypothetical protein
MGIFNKFFGKENDSELNTESKNKIKRSIFDFFKIDLLEIPNDIFVEGVRELNSSGTQITKYRANLNYLECDIFDTIELIKFWNNSKNISFQSFNLSKVKINKVKKLIDSLYLIYGNDDDNKGKFNDNELNDYYSKDFYGLFGRNWMDHTKYKNTVRLGIDRDSDTMTLTIWGIESNKMTPNFS